MYTNKKLFRIALPTLLGLTLTGTGLMVARAQDSTTDQGTKSNKSMKSDKHHRMDDDNMMTDDEMDIKSAPLSYPQSAPGSLHLYHWTDYTKTEMKEGSVAETDRDRMHRMAMKMHRRDAMMTDDEKMDEKMGIDPAPMGYPRAAPGSLHLYHWTDYTKTDIAPGSAADQRDKETRMMEMKMHRRDAMMTDDEKMADKQRIDPAPMGYPQAAPGSLHLYHWTDYTESTIAPGSAAEQRDKQARKADKAMRDNESMQK